MGAVVETPKLLKLLVGEGGNELEGADGVSMVSCVYSACVLILICRLDVQQLASVVKVSVRCHAPCAVRRYPYFSSVPVRMHPTWLFPRLLPLDRMFQSISFPLCASCPLRARSLSALIGVECQ